MSRSHSHKEFAWERLDRTAADFLYDNRALLVDTGLLDADVPIRPAGHLGRGPRAPTAR